MSFELLREGYVVLEYNSNFYRLHTTKQISFSQTFQQNNVRKRTLHNLDKVIEGSSITTSNPANFSFTIFLVEGVLNYYQHIPLDLLIEPDTNLTRYLKTFNLYFVYSDYNPNIYYKIENCFFTSGNFKIPRNGIITIELTGQGSKLTRNTGSYGSLAAGYDISANFVVSRNFDIWVGSPTPNKLDNVIGAAIELQNDVEWLPNKTIQESLQVSGSNNTIFPSDFVFRERKLAGTIQQYIDQSNTYSNNNVLTWAEDTSVRIKAGWSSSNYDLEFILDNSASFTNRSNVGEVFTQNYDFRLTSTPSNWASVIIY